MLSFIEATALLLQDQWSRNEISIALASMEFGYPERSVENIKAFYDGRKVKYIAPHLTDEARDKRSSEFRDRSFFHVKNDNRTRKINRWKKHKGSDEYEWFGGMVTAWKEALRPRHTTATGLHRVCRALGEEQFFFLVLKPWFDAAHGRGPIPPLCLPDFIPHDGT